MVRYTRLPTEERDTFIEMEVDHIIKSHSKRKSGAKAPMATK